MQDSFFLTDWLFLALKWINENVTAGHIVLTVVVVTLALKLLTIFSDIKTRKSTAKMASVQPEVDKINQRYKDNPQKARLEQTKLLKQAGVSMWSSCLPMLITLPLFFCFFSAFRFWGNEQMVQLLVTANNDVPAAQETFLDYKFMWINNVWQPDNGLSPVVMDAKTFLTTADLTKLKVFQESPEMLAQFEDMGMVFESKTAINGSAESTKSFIPSEGAIAKYNELTAPLIEPYAGFNNGWFLLPIISAASMFFSSRLTQQKQQNKGGASTPEQRQQQSMGKGMMYIFPVMGFIACLSNNAAFAIYWTTSNLVSIGINLILNKKYPRNPVATEALEEGKQ